MKNLTKIFMAIAVAMFAFSCVNDATEDIAVKVGGKTTLAISLENTRTQLGEAADGVYPITWAEGDQITVNGETSNELTAVDGAGTANAVFTFNTENLSTPYCVAYPAAADVNQVVFAAEQEYVDGTFASGAATMYGYSEDGKDLTLNHLTGVLKIGVVCGEDVDLFEAPVIQTVKISTIDRAPIAGTFNINFATGVVTPTAEATSVITYNVDMKLSQSPTYLHIAAPAGVYNELYVTLEDKNGGVMYKTVKANDDNPLAAGNVREFTTPIVYVATDEEENLVVRDYSSLLTVKETIEAAEEMGDTATLAKDITFVADVEINPAMTTTIGAWSPIAAPNYKGTVKGNGYAINGLTQPLFDVTAASFKGLHLNVEIEETVNPNVGAFARKIVATDNTPVVSNCSLRGSVVINTNITPAEADVLTDGASGGFAGIASGVHFEDCVNYASLELKQYSATTKMWGIMGGIVGYTEPANGLFTSFTNCANKGELKYSDTTGKTAADLAGIISVYTGYKATATFDNCSNSGNIVVDENAKTRDCNIGGLVAVFESAYDGSDNQNKKNISFTNNTTNSGAILVNGTVANTARIGGIIGWSDFFNTIEMNGPVTNSGRIAFTKSGKVVYLGGIMGINGSSTLNFNNFATNTESATIEMSGTSTGQTYLGGFIGVSSETKSDITPYTRIVRKTATNNANLTISGKVGGVCNFGGYIGYSYNTNTYMNKNGRFINNGILKVSEAAEISDVLRIGGMAGYVNGNSITVGSNNKGQVINTGKIIFEGTSKGGVQIGGLFGVHWTSVANASLSVISIGDIVATGKFNSSKVCHVGGFMGRTGSSTQINRNIKASSQIYCDITAYTVAKNGDEYTFTPYNNVGMVTGNTDDDMADCANAQIGGRIATTATVVNGVVAPTWVSLTSTNYADYVFGVRNNLTEYAGASRLESKDSIVWGNYGNN